MIGTLVNCATILTGSFIGSRLKKGIREEHQELSLIHILLRDKIKEYICWERRHLITLPFTQRITTAL